MSKIAKQKALEAYPMDEYEFDKAKKSDIERKRFAYIKGYEQALQDFLEYLKHCSTFTDMNGNTRIDNDLLNILNEQFKNYMQDEM